MSSAWSSVPDNKLAAQFATQSTAGRRPAVGTTTAGLPTAVFTAATPTQLSLPVAANNNSTQKWGFALWLSITTYAALKYILSIGGATGRYDNCKAEINFDGSRRCNLAFFGQDTSNYTGRQLLSATNSCPAANTPFWLRAQFDGTQATELLRHKIFINGVDVSSGGTYSNVGSGGTPVLLRPNAENIPIILGSYDNTADATFATSFKWGSNAYFFNGSPSAANDAKLMAFDAMT